MRRSQPAGWHTMDERDVVLERLIQHERLSALGQMAAGIAHDLNNSLSQAALYAEALAAAPELANASNDVQGCVALIRAGIEDAASVVRRLREVYRPRGEADVFGVTDLAQVVEETVALTRPRWRDLAQADGRTITLRTQLERLPPLPADGAALREALTNLIFNAVDALETGGEIEVSLRSECDGVVLAVRDDGVGMTPEQQARCLEPFFTTKGIHGTGLGLAMVHGIAQRHGGHVEIESEVGRGTTVSLRLPLREANGKGGALGRQTAVEPASALEPGTVAEQGAAAEAGTETGTEAARRAKRARVLVVDDNRPVRVLAVDLLERAGYRANGVASGKAALAQMERAGQSAGTRYDVVVTDQAMPGMSGTQLAEEIAKRAPGTAVVLLTGFAHLLEGEALPRGVHVLVAKPVDVATLRGAIESAMKLARTGPERIAGVRFRARGGRQARRRPRGRQSRS